VQSLDAVGHRYFSGISAPQGSRQAMPPAQIPAHVPSETGAQADPGGRPSAAQSASFSQSEQIVAPSRAQKLLFAVVRMQAQVSEPLHVLSVGELEQRPGSA
jgi:hypothetical protein